MDKLGLKWKLSWTARLNGLDGLGPKSETEYALLLAVDLVAFALISYVGRLGGAGKDPSGGYVLAGSTVVLFFMFLLLLSSESDGAIWQDGYRCATPRD